MNNEFYNLSVFLEQKFKVRSIIANSIALTLFTKMASSLNEYHNPTHVNNMLSFAKENNIELNDAEVLSIYFHDAIYDVSLPKTANEYNSVSFITALLFTYVPDEILSKAVSIILDTASHLNEVYVSPDSNNVMDLDLCSFVSPDFIRDCNLISKEYKDIPFTEYLLGRHKFITQMLAKYSIYRTQYMIDKFEQKARDNLKKHRNDLEIALEFHNLIRKYSEVPFSNICKYDIFYNMLRILEKEGNKVDEKLIRAVLSYDDKAILKILSKE